MTRKDSRERSRKASVRNIIERDRRVRDEYPGIIADLKRIASRLRALRAMTDVDDIDAAIENLEWERGVINAL